jgi:hypothetical protein
MSVDIINSNLTDLKDIYLSSSESKHMQTQTLRFLPVHEVIRRLGLESQMTQLINDVMPYRVKSSSPLRDSSKTPSKEVLGSDHHDDAANFRSDNEDSEEDLKRIVFEFRDRYYVNEDQELQKEVEKFNKASTSPYDQGHSEYSDENQLSANGIMRRNHKFLFNSGSSNDDRSCSIGAVEESLYDEETPRSLIHSGFRKCWFTDLFEEFAQKESLDKYSSNPLYDIYVNGAPRGDRTSKSTNTKLSIRKLPREDYYYKLDDDISREMHEKRKGARSPAPPPNFLDCDDKKEREKSSISTAPLLMNFIDQKTLEMQENDKQSTYTFGFPNKQGAKTDDSKDKKVDPKDSSKPKTTPKKKKKKGNQIIIDDNEEEASLFRTKPKKGKAKKNDIRQQQLAKAQEVKEEAFQDDEVSEIPQTGLDESLDNDKDELIEDLLTKRSDTRYGLRQPSELANQGNTDTPAGEDSPARSETAATFPTSDGLNTEAGDGKDKKKKKKKPKKPTIVSKPGSQTKDVVNEELSQPDKEKDIAINEVDVVLRKNENLLLMIFDVLDNNFMSEEFYVDKRRHFRKYVYVSDLGTKTGK